MVGAHDVEGDRIGVRRDTVERGGIDLTGNCRSFLGQNFGFYTEQLFCFQMGPTSLIPMCVCLECIKLG